MGFVGQRLRIDFRDKSTLVEANSSIAFSSLRNKAGLRFNGLILLSSWIAGLIPFIFVGWFFFPSLLERIKLNVPLSIFALTEIDSAGKELALPVLPDLRNHFHVEKLAHTFFIGGGSLLSVLLGEELPVVFPETESIVKVKGFLPLWWLLFIASKFIDVGDVLLLLGEDPGSEGDLLDMVCVSIGLEGLEVDSIHSQCCYNYIIPEII